MYLVWKWLHIVAVISWMAGILYLFRIYIYHAKNRADPACHALLKTMALRLYKYITVPAMVVTYFAGIAIIASVPAFGAQPWFHVKFLLVLLLSGVTAYGGKLRKRFADDSQPVPSVKALRYMNEIPTVLMLIIVGMVVFKPWEG
jgi:protoporphyrinogen IX oxidase